MCPPNPASAQGDEVNSSPQKIKFDAPSSFAYNNRGADIRIGAHALNLRVVHQRDVLLHEHTEAQRVAKLVERIQIDQFLKNPPIVVCSDGKYILLDGATRVTALRQLGYDDVVVQVVDYDMPGLLLENWNHLLAGLPVENFVQALQQLAGLDIRSVSIDQALDALAQRSSIGALLFASGQVLSLRAPSDASLSDQIDLLNNIVAAYEGQAELQRITHANVAYLNSERTIWNALVAFPRFQPHDIRALAVNGHKLPTGITRHIIPGRAMRINLPLEILQRDESLDAKNVWLRDWMNHKMRARHIRLYQEPVFLFDE